MTGASLLRIGAEAGAASGGGESAGTPDPVGWSSCYGEGLCFTGSQTIGGTGGYFEIGAALSGGGTLYYSWNSGPLTKYSGLPGVILVKTGDTLQWEIQNGTGSTVTGTATITDEVHSTTLGTFPYLVQAVG